MIVDNSDIIELKWIGIVGAFLLGISGVNIFLATVPQDLICGAWLMGLGTVLTLIGYYGDWHDDSTR